MANKWTVAVVGAGGRMGKEVVKLVLGDDELELVAAVGRSDAGADAGTLVGLPACGITVTSDLEMALVESKPDVMVDLQHRSLPISTRLWPLSTACVRSWAQPASRQSKSKSWTSSVWSRISAV